MERERSWTRKHSTVCDSEDVFEENLNNGKFLVPTALNTHSVEDSRRTEIPKAKKAVNKTIQEQTLQHWNEKVKSLTMQGEFTQLLVDEEENVMWQSVVRNVPRGVLSFALRSATNSLPSPDNLRRWGKRNVSTCPLCLNHGTLQHILNFCSVSLNQGRFTCLAPRLCTKIHHRRQNMKIWRFTLIFRKTDHLFPLFLPTSYQHSRDQTW